MKEQVREEPKIMAAAERQMQAWSITQEAAEQAVRLDRAHDKEAAQGKFIAISREAGADGGQIAKLVGQRMEGWEVLDRELLDRVAERSQLSKPMLEMVDETTANWAYDVLGTWIDRKIVSHEKYVVHLCRAVLEAAHRGNVILVGRAAQFILSRKKGLTVRIIAPEKYRIRQTMARLEMTEADARRFIRKTDKGRRDFAERFFHHSIDDPHLYDLVINVARIGPEAAADMIVQSHRL